MSRRGLSSGGKIGILVILVMIVLGAVYFLPSFTLGGGNQGSSSTQAGSSSGFGPSATYGGLAQLFANFSQIDGQLTLANDVEEMYDQQHFSYAVVGTGTINNTQYMKVSFSGIGAHQVIAWVSRQGAVDRVDVVGQSNYTGPGARFYVLNYLNDFSVILNTSVNSTLLSMLSPTTQNSTDIGGTHVNLATYTLPAPKGSYKSLTVSFATIPGTTARLPVYLHQKTTDGSELTLLVSSLKH